MTQVEALDTPQVLVFCPPFLRLSLSTKGARAMLPALADS